MSSKIQKDSLNIDLSEPASIPKIGIDRAIEIMRSGRLFRYGEFKNGKSEVASLEREFSQYIGSRYAVATNSCGSAMFIGLKSAGVVPGDKVLVNTFTLAPVPGAISHAGANPVFIESDENCRLDLNDLQHKAKSGAKLLLLSHMRGHIADMDKVQEICKTYEIRLIEDCAHTLGARWNRKASGTFGNAACFSLQTFKHINAGEGGILTTDDDDIAAQAILYAGSYMLYAQNGARPPLEVFERHKRLIPNFSLRMHEVTAAVARPQIDMLEERAKAWKKRYKWLADFLGEIEHVRLPDRDLKEDFIPSSIQFFLDNLSAEAISDILDHCRRRGLDIKWFGNPIPQGFTSTWEDWKYISDNQNLPYTQTMLHSLCDMRIPLTIKKAECRLIAQILNEAITLVESS
ncbi:MAG: aminotransferase [Woeseia sp.]|nr:aminotransferase [Woeseia sp.]|tara:strand:+ start:510 stop:1721 length:1212 start_codon:yes stop_codon:yes gene_type:complete